MLSNELGLLFTRKTKNRGVKVTEISKRKIPPRKGTLILNPWWPRIARYRETISAIAPYCALWGFLVSQHGQLGAIPPPPFLGVSPSESMRSGGAIPPPQKGYLSDTCAIPYENKANGCDTPLCDTISKRYCAIGGVSRTGPLSLNPWMPKSVAISNHCDFCCDVYQAFHRFRGDFGCDFTGALPFQPLSIKFVYFFEIFFSWG